MKKVYLAGPQVFLKDPMSAAQSLKEICAMYGFEGLFPLDGQLELKDMGSIQKAIAIYHADILLIDKADFLVADMTPFRGASMDVGTAFEMGYAVAQGKPVFGYSHDGHTYAKKVMNYTLVHTEAGGILRDDTGMLVENNGLIDNLMMVAPVLLTGNVARSFEEAIFNAQKYLHKQKLK
jgi:nucleoside 2-deoxyribosyltransferase